MLLIDYARNEVGLPMGTLYAGMHIGWTTDAVKAVRCGQLVEVVEINLHVEREGFTGNCCLRPVQEPSGGLDS